MANGEGIMADGLPAAGIWNVDFEIEEVFRAQWTVSDSIVGKFDSRDLSRPDIFRQHGKMLVKLIAEHRVLAAHICSERVVFIAIKQQEQLPVFQGQQVNDPLWPGAGSSVGFQ